MEETGKYIIQQVPKIAEFHSVVMTTFSFDFHFFESQVLRLLKQKGVTSFNVMVDTSMLDKSIGFSTGHLKDICNHYSVHSVPCVGAFHPKIIFLAGKDDIMFIQGSGNITNGGHGKNHEIFSAYYANGSDQTLLPIIQETWDYIKSFLGSIKGIGASKILRLERECNLLNKVKPKPHSWNVITDDFSVASLYNEKTGIWNQVRELIPKETVKEIMVFSPFYDEDGTLLVMISNYFNCPIKAFLQPNRGIHPYKMPSDKNINLFSWESTFRSTVTTKKYLRKLHAKIFWFDTGEIQYCLFGSPNCTINAFGTEKSRGINDEFALLVKLKENNWMSVLGLDGDYKNIIPQSNEIIQKLEKNLEKESIEELRKVNILGVDQNEETLTIYITNFKEIRQVRLVIYNQWGEELEDFYINPNGNIIELQLKTRDYKAVAYVEILNLKGERISNKQIVNTYFDLWNSDPSEDNRNFIKLGSKIEIGGDGLFDVVDLLSTIQAKNDAKMNKTQKRIQIGSQKVIKLVT
ncbi:MAG: hypothetical protein IPL20_00145 [Saprospiraceae bacterium]|nr:hypothetical protein [Saprospiraceae bacterium]